MNQIDERLKIPQGLPLPPAERAKVPAGGSDRQNGPAFDALLRAELAARQATAENQATGREPLRFSAHAARRLELREIPFGPEQMGKLAAAVDKAAAKGARESLVLMKDVAFIVSIPNRTVITAMSGESLKENVFTNIDSAVIAG